MARYNLLLLIGTAASLIASFSASRTYENDPACFCTENGNTYSPVISSGCSQFTQSTAFLQPETQYCPDGLIFDVQTCVCNRPEAAYCPQTECPSAAPAYHPDSKSCSEKGNTYRQLPWAACTQFTQSTKFLSPVIHSCPPGLQFDLKTCVCNWPHKTKCHFLPFLVPQ